ncbi:hypothetical protein AADZ90_017975 [Aestuariibius sp. 2305UL40-4]|uniref:hypothetical protein n=1 Tax=Aestuariibius violaceus TaxID=3234132 RepID=UPI00345F134B
MRYFFYFLIVLPVFAAAETLTVTGVGEVRVAPELAWMLVQAGPAEMPALADAMEEIGAERAAGRDPGEAVFVLRDLEQFDAAIEAAGAGLRHVRFGVADPGPVRAEAVQRAVVQGMGKAAAAGLILGGLEKLDEVGSGWRGNGGRVVPGEIRFVATVNLVYRVQD